MTKKKKTVSMTTCLIDPIYNGKSAHTDAIVLEALLSNHVKGETKHVQEH